MNKKKIFGYLFMGLLAAGATGTVTSCKDYDDDINKNATDIKSLQKALEEQKTTLEGEISSLKTQLEAKDAELTTAIQKAQSAADGAKEAAANEATRAAAAEAALDARLKTAESALESINKVLANKVDQSEYDATVKDIYAKIETVQSGLADQLKQTEALKKGLADEETARKAVAADLEQQKTALATLKNTVEDLSAKIGTLSGKFESLSQSITELQNTINDAENGLDSKASITQLTDVQNTLDAKINKVLADVNALNVLLKQSLRSLFFVPDLYNWGVEGTRLLTLDAPKFTLDGAKYNVEDASTKTDEHYIYESVDVFQVLDFQANYNMNPSSTDPKSIKNVTLLSGDKDFYTRAAAAGLSVKNFTVNPENKPGILSVNLDVTHKDAIKNVTNDHMITVFAVQAHINNGVQDTTITSDWATVIKDEAKHLYLFHKNGPTSYNVLQSDADDHVPACAARNVAGLGHLIHTGYQAGKVTAPQDSCNWNDSIDLKKLVETHFVDADGVEKVFDADKYGLSYKFELVGLFKGDNNTSESAHAAIKGSMFRPQMPNYDKDNVGTQQPYGYKQDRQTIGRTPLVRVSLVDKNGNVYAYGYIRIKITEAGKTPEGKTSQYISYTGKDYTYNQECLLPTWDHQTTWIQTEYDLYNMVGMTREEFEASYTPDYTSADVFKQYTLKKVGTKHEVTNPETDQNTVYYTDAEFAVATKDYGTVKHYADAASTEDGTRTSVIRWNMTGQQAYDAMKDGKPVQIAVRYISNVTGKPDVYVVMNTGKVTITKPSATVKWTDAIISNYWYATNATAGKSGTDEIHANVPSPEDAGSRGLTVATFTDMFSNVFDGNFVSGKSLFSQMMTINDQTKANEYAAKNLTVNFIFDKSNAGRTFKGISGQTYIMALSSDAKDLVAKTSPLDEGQVVAKITGQNYKNEAATYQNTEYAKDLLNYTAHNALNNDFLVATIGIKAVNECGKVLPIEGETFDVRFLRPLNVIDNNAEIEDANIVKVQEIKIVDLVKFNDWRDAWDNKASYGPYVYKQGYTKYYGIKSIKIDGVANGNRISTNSKVKTNLGLNSEDAKDPSKWVSLKSVSDQVDFYYVENSNIVLSENILRYTNLSSTLSDFDVIVPVTVEYYWGKLHAYATIHVKSTAGGNAAKRH